MPDRPTRILKSWSNGKLLAAARGFLSEHPEAVALIPGRLAGDSLLYTGGGALGIHRFTLTQYAASLARPGMADGNLVPLSSLGLEAVVARIVHASRSRLHYF